jgi:hypothetical protein
MPTREGRQQQNREKKVEGEDEKSRGRRDEK